MSELSIDDILNGDDVEVAEVAQETEQVTDTAEQAANEDTKGEAEEEAQAEPEAKAETPTAEDDVEQEWTKSMALDERRKRQAVEKQLDELKKAQEEAARTPRPDLIDDPEGALSHMQAEFDQKLRNQTIAVGQEMMRSMHEDYDTLEAEFVELAKSNPVIAQGVRDAANPAKYAYDIATKAREAAALTDTGARDKLKQQLRAEVLAEQEAEKAKQAKKDGALSPSLASSKAEGGSVESFVIPSLDDILK